jgi:leucyl aminopeptidase
MEKQMRQHMHVSSESADPAKKKTAALCFFVSEKSDKPFGLPKMEPKLHSAIKHACAETKGKVGSTSVIYTHQTVAAERILLAGVGPGHKITHEQIRLASGKIARKVIEMGLDEFCIVIQNDLPLKSPIATSAAIEGACLAAYSFDKYRKERKKQPSLTVLVQDQSKITNIVSKARIISDGVTYARSIANLPPNECSPASMAGFAKSLSSKNKIKCTIMSKNELRKQGFGGISAVGQGSKNEPKLIILEYNGKNDQRPIIIVGKAVTFDTGGISLKPADKMDEMKFDKCGGCTVLGIIKAAFELKMPINLVGIIPAVENMPGGESYRPGDIIKMYGGKTAEILNTDAEGRLILFDAISYGIKKYKPKEVIDFATLTGACIVALGANVAGLVSNNNKLADGLKRSSDRTGEQVWQLPINEDYMDMIKSDFAEIKNVGPGRVAGAITAAAFLASAVGNTPWAHFDIAGTAWVQTGSKDKSYNPNGATGFGVRLILDYLSSP